MLELDGGGAHARTAPNGVEIVSLAERPTLLEGMYRVASDTYDELGGHMPLQTRSCVKWQAHELGPGRSWT
jgi:hypothetical protein